ncbi:MAG: DUF429 domain-containing protein [Infirmifilum sp.]
MIMFFGGLDLTAGEVKASYLAFLDLELRARVLKLYTDEEILNNITRQEVYAMGIDSPLSFPKQARERGCERMLRELGIKFFPPVLPAMEKLTKRGMKLAATLEKAGIRVLEVYPGGTQDLLCIPRKKASLVGLKEGLERLGIKFVDAKLNGDALDAVTAAYTVYLYWRGDYLRLKSGDCELILPVPRCLPRIPSRRY